MGNKNINAISSLCDNKDCAKGEQQHEYENEE